MWVPRTRTMIVVVIDVIDDQPRGRSLHEMTSSNHTIRSCRRLLRATVTEIKMNKWSQLPKMRMVTIDQKRDVLTSNNRLLLLLAYPSDTEELATRSINIGGI